MSEAMEALFAGDAGRAEQLLRHDRELTLHEAAAFGRTARMDEILAGDPAKLNALSPDGFTALHLAIFGGRDDSMRTLIAHGADLNVVSAGSIARVPPLGTAVFMRSERLAGLLLDAGADVNARYGDDSVALHVAAVNGDEGLIRLLLGRGADPTARNDKGKRPQDVARDERIRSLLA